QKPLTAVFTATAQAIRGEQTPGILKVLLPPRQSRGNSRYIRQLKEYRRRAVGKKLADGVDLVLGVSQVVTIATEPRMEESLPWLDPKNKDDQLLATVIEVMRMRPRSRVWLITGDINLQNKAEFANVPFMEPPDPV
ncbi:MAG: PIN domain-containing protein, partial [Terracidiphilus sp.]